MDISGQPIGLIIEDGIYRLSRNVDKYYSTLRKIQEERR